MATKTRPSGYQSWRQIFLIAATIAFLLNAVRNLSGQTWTPTSAPLMQWLAVASSADGARIVASTREGPIYISTNSGASWTSSSPAGQYSNWNGVACSASGTTIIAAGFITPICVSTNSGANWMMSDFTTGFQSVASSADGSVLVAVGWYDGDASYIYVSTNSGVSWSVNRQDDSNYIAPWWASTAMSADGRTLLVSSSRATWISTDSGVTWASNSIGSIFQIRCSVDATKIATVGWNGLIYTSTNSGASWSPGTNLFNGVLSWLSCSANGDKLLAAAHGGLIYSSKDWGDTWIQEDAPSAAWHSIRCSADGSRMVAVEYSYPTYTGRIYTARTTPTPWLNIAPSEAGLLLSWNLPSIPFGLQQKPDFTTTNWTDVLTPPAVRYETLRSEITVPTPTGPTSYRLISR